MEYFKRVQATYETLDELFNAVQAIIPTDDLLSHNTRLFGAMCDADEVLRAWQDKNAA